MPVNVDGGALHTEYSGCSLFVSRSTFLRIEGFPTRYGVIICTSASLCEIDSCCFREGQVDYGYGLVLALRGGESGSRANITNSNSVSCGNPSVSLCGGTIFVETGYTVEYSVLNFTECKYQQNAYQWGTGVAFYHQADTGSWTFEYCTVLKCVGSGVIYSGTATRCHVGYCNFYDNDVDYSHLYTTSTGMEVASCIFNGNPPYIKIASVGYELFEITNFVFSKSLPDSAYWESNDANYAGITTASRAVVHFHTGNCPTASPTASDKPPATHDFTPNRLWCQKRHQIMWIFPFLFWTGDL
jgi:hypothetical protein